ncbi:hypothetical protein HDU85_003624 [Gaertneriomyces sp. JEL0708]|nr:hypothetical protein HDU85_003624 [Gaertneriomyces sp. JEL0708]
MASTTAAPLPPTSPPLPPLSDTAFVLPLKRTFTGQTHNTIRSFLSFLKLHTKDHHHVTIPLPTETYGSRRKKRRSGNVAEKVKALMGRVIRPHGFRETQVQAQDVSPTLIDAAESDDKQASPVSIVLSDDVGKETVLDDDSQMTEHLSAREFAARAQIKVLFSTDSEEDQITHSQPVSASVSNISSASSSRIPSIPSILDPDFFKPPAASLQLPPPSPALSAYSATSASSIPRTSTSSPERPPAVHKVGRFTVIVESLPSLPPSATPNMPSANATSIPPAKIDVLEEFPEMKRFRA